MGTPTWIGRVWAEYKSGNLTRAYRDVLITLHTYRGPGGTAWPSHQTLAERANAGVRTVQRALAMARCLGLVDWRERRRRSGWRWLRTSNLYGFAIPVGPVQPSARPAFPKHSTTRQTGGGGERINNKEALRSMLADAARGPDLLAARRMAVEATLAKRATR